MPPASVTPCKMLRTIEHESFWPLSFDRPSNDENMVDMPRTEKAATAGHEDDDEEDMRETGF